MLAVEILVFTGLYLKYKEVGPIAMCAVLGFVMTFVASARMVLRPIG